MEGKKLQSHFVSRNLKKDHGTGESNEMFSSSAGVNNNIFNVVGFDGNLYILTRITLNT